MVVTNGLESFLTAFQTCRSQASCSSCAVFGSFAEVFLSYVYQDLCLDMGSVLVLKGLFCCPFGPVISSVRSVIVVNSLPCVTVVHNAKREQQEENLKSICK